MFGLIKICSLIYVVLLLNFGLHVDPGLIVDGVAFQLL